MNSRGNASARHIPTKPYLPPPNLNTLASDVRRKPASFDDEYLPGRQVLAPSVKSVQTCTPQSLSDRIQALAQPLNRQSRAFQSRPGDVNPRQVLAVARAHGLVNPPMTDSPKPPKIHKEIIPTIYQHPKPVFGDQTKSKDPVPKKIVTSKEITPSKFQAPLSRGPTAIRSDINTRKTVIPAGRSSGPLPNVSRVGPSVGQIANPKRPPFQSKVPDTAMQAKTSHGALLPVLYPRRLTPASVKSPEDADKQSTLPKSSAHGGGPGNESGHRDENQTQTVQSTDEGSADSGSEESDSSDDDEAPPTVRAPVRRAEPASAVSAKASVTIRYHTDQGFRPLLCAFRNLQWRDFANRGRWHMFWANVANARALFQPGQRYYFNDDQLVNHYQTCYHLSRKDNMTKNIKKYRNEMAHAKDPIGRKDKHGNFLYLDLIAPTYLLPFDFNTFLAEYKKNGGLYIVKPCSGSQGQGIFLVNQLDQAKRWQERALAEIAACVQDNEAYQGYLISRYISNPLLIDGKKFDLRIYILVTSFKPLRCYYYRHGFCRFCATRYSQDVSSIDNKFMHLTNVAVQKQKKGYNRSHGNKWSLTAFRLYMERVYGRGKTDSLFDRIFWMIVQSLRSVQSLMDNDRHCYEMYGYDCLIDANLKPWLLEVNASPSIEDTTPVDRVVKTNLLSDTMRMALYERCPHLLGIKEKKSDGSDMPLGEYEILYLEEPAPKLTPAERKMKANLTRHGTGTVPLTAPPSLCGSHSDKPRWTSI